MHYHLLATYEQTSCSICYNNQQQKKFNEDQLHTVEPETLRLSDRFDEAIGLEEKIDPFLLEDALPLPVEDL